MLSITLPDELETAVTSAADRTGLTVNDYLASVCADALSLENDRARVDSHLTGTAAVSHGRANEWLSDLASGNRTFLLSYAA
jgi:hypothetical protein